MGYGINEKIMKELDEKVNGMSDELIRSTQTLVKIRSLEEKAEDGMPFGKGVNKALVTALNEADKLGFKTKNVDGYAGHVEMGKGEKLIGILCHLDIVPEGRNWTYPPYAAEIHDGKLYGRGVIDNKGPAIAALYAMKAVQDCGIEIDKRVRLILGTDEESGWEGLSYYLENEEAPDFGFSPDAEFPVIHGEKGILTFNLKKELNRTTSGKEIIVKSITGGNAPNMVPDYCEARLEIRQPEKFEEMLNNFVSETGYRIEMTETDDGYLITSYGISAHGSLPGDGENAISSLMLFLDRLELPEDELKDLIHFYSDKIGMEYSGEAFGCALIDDLSGPLTLNVGMVRVDSQDAEVVINIRYPVTKNLEEVLEPIKDMVEKRGFKLQVKNHNAPLYLPKDDPLVKRLMMVYRKFTGDEREPITIGGGTYARALKKAVAFGPLFPDEPELAHQKDEYLKVENLVLITKIFAAAIIELLEME